MDKKLNKKEKFIALLIIGIYLLLLGKYFDFFHYVRIEVPHLLRQANQEYKSLTKKSITCQKTEQKIQVAGGYVCSISTVKTVYSKIYTTYPLSNHGKEIIYTFLDDGSISNANKNLKNIYPIDRYKDVAIPKITWKEDPYNQTYWRFMFYSLRWTKDLLNASRYSDNGTAYAQKLNTIIHSFLTKGINQKYSFNDSHAVAFRTMVLVNTWWKLREENQLSESQSTEILKALELQGNFLLDRNHYEPQNNHGVNEATALFLLAVNFPELKGSDIWLATAKDRINTGLNSLVDKDGVLIENSPYYELYTLDKFWQIYYYEKQYRVTIGNNFDTKIHEMIKYTTYMLQPNLQLPLIGASIQRTVHDDGNFSQMADEDPNLKYVLTKGEQGLKPEQTSIYYSDSGQAIMRAGWGKDKDFTSQMQVNFSSGPYKSNHSDYNNLAITLYGNGRSLLPDAGLYTYNPSKMKSYFISTEAHNTVMVDGQNQRQGTGVAGKLIQGDGYTYQSAENDLNPGVNQERSVMLIGKSLVLILDKLSSQNIHTYSQMFHLFPGAVITQNGLTINAKNTNNTQELTIHQLDSSNATFSKAIGDYKTPKGLCSEKYQVAIPCYELAYTKKGNDASFATLLEVGKPDQKLKAEVHNNQIFISTSDRTYQIAMQESKNTKQIVVVANNSLPSILETIVLPYTKLPVAPNLLKKPTSDFMDSVAESMTTLSNASYSAITKDIHLDLSNKNVLFRIKVSDAKVLKHLELDMSTDDNWDNVAEINLMNAYRVEYANEWLTVSLGKGQYRTFGGPWQIEGTGFSWANINHIRFRAASMPGKETTVRLFKFSTMPAQPKGHLVMIFDDGYSSVAPAADVLHTYNFKANIAVISGYVKRNAKGYFTLDELKSLQNDYGWNMVNHSDRHKDALTEYYDTNQLGYFEQDILTGAKFLLENHIDSDPNWYIYPLGSTNDTIKNIIGKYYKFARVEIDHPEVYPFGDPLGVKVLALSNNTPVDILKQAVLDANIFHQTLFITFHRIQSSPTDRPGYSLDNFKQFIAYVKQQGIEVNSLSDLDKENGVSMNKMKIIDGMPSQIVLSIHQDKKKNIKNILLLCLYVILLLSFMLFYIYSRFKNLHRIKNLKYLNKFRYEKK